MLKAYSLLKKCVKQSSMWFPTQAVHCVTAQVEAYPLVAGLFILNLVQGVVISHLVIIFKDWICKCCIIYYLPNLLPKGKLQKK